MACKKFTKSEIKSGNRLISHFLMGKKCFPSGIHKVGELNYHRSWSSLMPARYKIERIGAHLKIDGMSELYWSYSPKKTGTFSKGAGGGGGWTEKRDPFDSIFGKSHTRYVGVLDSAETLNRETEILATWDNIVYFIKWLNRVCPHLRNHVQKDK